jgi:hypothetical protein
MVLVVEGTGDKRRIVSVGITEWLYTLSAGQEFRTIPAEAWKGYRKADVYWNEKLKTIVLGAYPLSTEEAAKEKYLTTMVLEKFARVLLLELNAIRAGQARPQEVTDFIDAVKDYLP